jgi:tight adherence protein B
MNSAILFWCIPLLYLVSFTGLTYALIRALQAGADTYARVCTEQTSRQFADIFLFIPPRRILEITWIAALSIFLLLFFLAGNFWSVAGALRGLVVGGLGALLILAVPKRLLIYYKVLRLRRFNEQLVDALMTMSNALRAGASILQAFEHIVKEGQNPIAQEFSFFLQQTRVGVKFEEALGNLEKRVNSEDLTLMIRAIEIARQTGGNLTEVFEKIAATIRERLRIQERVRTLTAQGRMQGIIVGLMPLGLGIVMFIIDPAMMITFFTSAIGIIVGVVIVLLEICGALLIRKIVNIDI